jgi:hypothetical protein
MSLSRDASIVASPPLLDDEVFQFTKFEGAVGRGTHPQWLRIHSGAEGFISPRGGLEIHDSWKSIMIDIQWDRLE